VVAMMDVALLLVNSKWKVVANPTKKWAKIQNTSKTIKKSFFLQVKAFIPF